MLAILFWLLSLFIIVKPVLAGNPPTLISPSSNSSISTVPTFSWQAVPNSIKYNILIDDEPTVTSPYAKNPYYPTNPNYSPRTLNPGTYYWKVKSQDNDGNWSGWSDIWSFTLTTSPNLSSPTPIPTPFASYSPIPTSNPTSSPHPTTFSISNLPSQINSDESFNILVNLSLPNNPNTNFYLKGAFKKSDSSNYFGFTKVAGNWIKNNSSYSDQYSITTDSTGKWSGNLEVKPDSSDSGFTGTEDYVFKVAQYTSSGSGPTWNDNQSTIKIITTENNNTSSTPVPSSNNISSETKLSVAPSAKATTTTLIKTTQLKNNTLAYQIASVEGATAFASMSATPSSKVDVKNDKQINPLILIGVILILLGIGTIGYIYIKKNGQIYLKIRQ